MQSSKRARTSTDRTILVDCKRDLKNRICHKLENIVNANGFGHVVKSFSKRLNYHRQMKYSRFTFKLVQNQTQKETMT